MPGLWFDDLTEGLWCQVAEQLAKIHTIPIKRFSDHISEFYGDALQNATASEGMRHYLDWWHDYWKSFSRFASPMEIYPTMHRVTKSTLIGVLHQRKQAETVPELYW